MEYPSKENKIILYQTDEGKVKIDVFFVEENFWMTQKTMGQLFDVQKAAVSKHLKNIYESGELDKASTVSIMETVQHEGGREIKRNIDFYNLDPLRWLKTISTKKNWTDLIELLRCT